MPFMDGAVIGAVIGGAIGVAIAAKQVMAAKWHKKLLAALPDRAAARAILDTSPVKRQHGKVALTKLLEQRQRMAALALMGDGAALADELGNHRGGPAYLYNVACFGVLGQALIADDAAPHAARMAELAQTIARDSNATQKLLRDRSVDLARVGRCLAGEPLADDLIIKVMGFVGADHIMTRALVLRALEVAAARAHRPNAMLRKKVAELMPGLAPA